MLVKVKIEAVLQKVKETADQLFVINVKLFM